jgi:hypothetical protein
MRGAIGFYYVPIFSLQAGDPLFGVARVFKKKHFFSNQ